MFILYIYIYTYIHTYIYIYIYVLPLLAKRAASDLAVAVAHPARVAALAPVLAGRSRVQEEYVIRICIYVYIYTYIYRWRERESGREI